MATRNPTIEDLFGPLGTGRGEGTPARLEPSPTKKGPGRRHAQGYSKRRARWMAQEALRAQGLLA